MRDGLLKQVANPDYLDASGHLVASIGGLLVEHGMAEEVAALAPHIRTVTEGQEIFPGVRVRITAGHTAGHAEYVITSGGRRLIAFGDALHSPIQIGHPEWSASVDHDPARSA
ncbi:hypothetical protein ACFQY7_24690 [Actinomadura luteofluorescens]